MPDSIDMSELKSSGGVNLSENIKASHEQQIVLPHEAVRTDNAALQDSLLTSKLMPDEIKKEIQTGTLNERKLAQYAKMLTEKGVQQAALAKEKMRSGFSTRVTEVYFYWPQHG